jgi:hypothetical protein
MLIPNPWPYHPHVRCTRASDGAVSICPAGPELDVPDADEILVEAIQFGRSDAPAVAPGKVWSKTWGHLDVEDHMKKVALAQQEAQLKADLEAKAAADKKAAAAKKAAAKKAAAKKQADLNTEAQAKASPGGVDDDKADLGDALPLD